MYCPFCSHPETKVLESRLAELSLRRRRECLQCQSRFTTYEEAVFHLTVIKQDGREEPFDLQKLTASLQKACSKAPTEEMAGLGQRLYQKILRRKKSRIKTSDIGKLVLQELKKADPMAYLRFASVHKDIRDPQRFAEELKAVVSS